MSEDLSNMVVLQVKRGDTDGFLFETTCDTSNDALIRELVRIYIILYPSSI